MSSTEEVERQVKASAMSLRSALLDGVEWRDRLEMEESDPEKWKRLSTGERQFLSAIRTLYNLYFETSHLDSLLKLRVLTAAEVVFALH